MAKVYSKNKKKRWESAYLNDAAYLFYYERLRDIAISLFKYENLPDTMDARYLELGLLEQGKMVLFEDEVLGYLSLEVLIGQPLDVYRNPIKRTAYAVNGYRKELDASNSVIIYNDLLRENGIRRLEYYARKLYEIDRSIDVNVKTQKTPVMILCNEQQRSTMKNLFMQYEGNEPFIYGDKNLDLSGVQVLNTGAPYVAGDLQDLKTSIWNEALTYLGVPNVNNVKKERLITDEVTRNMGGTNASRFSRLKAREQAIDKFNAMFGTNITVDYQEMLDIDNLDIMNAEVLDNVTEGGNKDE